MKTKQKKKNDYNSRVEQRDMSIVIIIIIHGGPFIVAIQRIYSRSVSGKLDFFFFQPSYKILRNRLGFIFTQYFL